LVALGETVWAQVGVPTIRGTLWPAPEDGAWPTPRNTLLPPPVFMLPAKFVRSKSNYTGVITGTVRKIKFGPRVPPIKVTQGLWN